MDLKRTNCADKLFGADAIPTLMEKLQAGDEFLRHVAAVALAQIGPQAVPALTAALQQGNSNVRACAAFALGRMGSDAKPAIPNLQEAAQDKDVCVRTTALDALKRVQEIS